MRPLRAEALRHAVPRPNLAVPASSLPAALQHRRWMIDPLHTLRAARARFGPVFCWDFPVFGPTVVVADWACAEPLLDVGPPALLGVRAPLSAVVGPRSVLTERGEAHRAARRSLGAAIGTAREWAHLFEESLRRRLAGQRRVDLYALALGAVTDALVRGLGGQPEDPVWEPVIDGVFGGPSPGHLYAGTSDDRWRALARLRGDLGDKLGSGGWIEALRRTEGAEDQALTLLGAAREPVAAACAWSMVCATRSNRLDEPERDLVVEALRLHPPGPLIRRVVGAPLALGPHRLEPATQLAFASTLLHRDPARFEDADRFLPERWRGRRPGRELLTWGIGIRRCVGARQAMAMLETFVRVLRPLHPRWISGPPGVEHHNLTLVPRARTVELTPHPERP